MIKTGISININKIANWLEATQKQPSLYGIACDTELFEQEETKILLQSKAIKCLLAFNLLPNDAGVIFSMSEQKNTLKPLFADIYKAMNAINQSSGCNAFTLNFALDQFKPEQWPAQSIRLQPLLATLIATPLPFDFTIQLPVSLPKAFPTSLELERSIELCNTINALPRENWDDSYGITERPPILPQSSLAMCLHIHQDSAISPEELCSKNILDNTKSIVFHYDVAAFETLFDDEQAQWAAYLKDNSFNGSVIFAPTNCPENRMYEICQDASAWTELYTSK